jgi:uncharacterized membrane protein
LKINLGSGLIVVNLLTLLLVLLITFFPSDAVRIILGLPFLLFFPGYTLTVAFFPANWRLSGMERVALSFGLSLALIPLIGMILNYTPFGIELESLMYSIASIILLFSLVAWYRNRKLNQFERFNVNFSLTMTRWRGNFWDKITNIVIIAATLGIVGFLGYLLITPRTGETFSEFYILNTEGQAGDYPIELSLGDTATVIIGIINQEDKDTTYVIEVMIGDGKSIDIGPNTLKDGQKWESEVLLSPEEAGIDQKVMCVLYKNGVTDPYLELHFWIDVYPS